jgi:2,3-dihydroxy-p-cumate/2,3-dihydroxybenzoate 3,4-dioxygenase
MSRVLELCAGGKAIEPKGECTLHRYLKLGYVAVNVSDLERSLQFYERLWGLQPNGGGPDGSRLLRCSNQHHDVMLYRGKPGLKRIGWQMETELDLQRLSDTLASNSLHVQEVERAECRALHLGPAVRFICPFTGVTHEYYAKMDDAADGWQPTVAKIQRVGHLVLKTPNYQQAVEFYLRVLNFRLSDCIGNAVSFMRCFPNPLHHSLGLSNAKAASLHHINFMVSEIDDIGRGLWRFQKSDVPIVRGPGRHPPSGSVFLYVLDPDGLTVEYSYGMEEFPETGDRDHRVLPMVPESIDFWGGPTDQRLGAIGEIEKVTY